MRNTPIEESIEQLNADFGMFAQDAWTIKPADTESRRALRLFQRRGAGALGAGEHVGAGA